MSDQPPPPPPHGGQGGQPKSGGLPPGKYDIFVIPEHSAGSGFLYLPSLQPNINSFVAGFASALILVVLGQSMAPAFRTWWESFQGLGNMGIVMLILGVGFGAWALGRTQHDGGPSFGSNFRPKPSASSGGPGGSSGYTGAYPGATPDNESSPPPPPPPPHGSGSPGGQQNGGPPPHGTRQHDDGYYPTGSTPPPHQEYRAPPPPKPEPSKPETPKSAPKSAWEKARDQYKGSWERAREETRKKEEERKTKEAEQKRREEAAKRLAELRAREAKERQARETERLKRENEAKEQEEKKKAEQRAKEALEKLERERKEREEQKKREEEKEKAQKAEANSKKGSSYAFSGVGEKTSMWPNGRPPSVPQHAPSPKSTASSKKPPPPTAKTYMSEDTYSYRPYDQPKKPARRKSNSSFAETESSWAPSQTTHRTSPPPSMRGPYSTSDPDKICISAVYLFMNQFAKTPASQLISGVGSVTDGLILRITTEGLFIDDDVRGVPQREWDVKAWTLKQVEVWCPPHCFAQSAAAAPAASAKPSPNLLFKMAAQSRTRNDKSANQVLTGEEADVHLAEMLRACNECCRLGQCERKFRGTNISSSSGQTGEWKSKGLHVLRATLRDQEAKRYLFVVDEAESWKVAVGLQRLRRGTQVRQLGVGSMTPSDARSTLEMLGWAQ